jgi:hypothetical protein
MVDPSLPASGTTRVAGADEPDWTDQVTDLVVDVVDRVHDSTTGPLLSVAKSIVVGVVAAIVGVAAVVLLTLLSVRALDLFPGRIWIPYLILGVLLTAGGLFLWGKRNAPAEA